MQRPPRLLSRIGKVYIYIYIHADRPRWTASGDAGRRRRGCVRVLVGRGRLLGGHGMRSLSPRARDPIAPSSICIYTLCADFSLSLSRCSVSVYTCVCVCEACDAVLVLVELLLLLLRWSERGMEITRARLRDTLCLCVCACVCMYICERGTAGEWETLLAALKPPTGWRFANLLHLFLRRSRERYMIFFCKNDFFFWNFT